MPLLDLPPELFERIAEFADTDSLCALRLVCRDARDKAFRTFRDTHFTTRRTYIFEPDLRILNDIVDHTTLGPALTKLEICVDEIDEIGRQYGMQTADPQTGYMPGHASYALRQAREEQINAQMTRRNANLLTVIFCKLRMLGCELQEVLFLDGCKRPRHHSPHLDLQRRPPQLDVYDSFTTVVESLRLANLPIESISMRLVEWSLPIHQVVAEKPCWESMQSSFSRIKRLKLDVWFNRMFKVAEAGKFATLLTSLHTLEELDLNIKSSCEDDQFTLDCMDSDIFASHLLLYTFPNSLKTLRLSGFQVRLETMQAFLKRADTVTSGIENFHLEDVCIDSVPTNGTQEHMDAFSVPDTLRSYVSSIKLSCDRCWPQFLVE